MVVSDSPAISRGHLQNIKSKSVIRMIRSERINVNKRHPVDVIDILIFQRKHLSFVKQICYPLNV